MTEREATQYVLDHADDDNLPDDEVEEVFRAIFGREPDDQDYEEGLWSHILACAEQSAQELMDESN